MFHVPECFRVTYGPLASDTSWGNVGAFVFTGPCGRIMSAIAADEFGWEHVSTKAGYANKKTFIPNWQEMCFVKDLFWDGEDVVMQLHPAKSQWISSHPSVLHLWRPIGQDIPLPPPVLVGIKGEDATTFQDPGKRATFLEIVEAAIAKL